MIHPIEVYVRDREIANLTSTYMPNQSPMIIKWKRQLSTLEKEQEQEEQIMKAIQKEKRL